MKNRKEMKWSIKAKRLVAFVLSISLVLGNPFAFHAQAKKKVALSKKTLTMTVGSRATLKVKNNKKKVKWATSNKKVVAIKTKSNNTASLSAKKRGSATITAIIAKKKDKCKVVVKKGAVEVDPESTTESSSKDDVTTTMQKTPTTEKVTTTESATTTTESATTTTEKVTTTEPATTTTQVPGQPSAETAAVDAGEFSIGRVHNGVATFYDRESTGAANLDAYEDIYYTAAMYEDDFLKNMAGAYLEVTDKDGDVVKVMITDILPNDEGTNGNLDLSRKAFLSIEPEVTGRMNISWKIIPLPTNEPICYRFKTTSSKWWAEVQVRNHRYPIAKFEYFDKSKNQYVELERKRYNYYAAPNGMGEGPYTFRVTDIYGHQLVDTGIQMNDTDTFVPGKANFPY